MKLTEFKLNTFTNICLFVTLLSFSFSLNAQINPPVILAGDMNIVVEKHVQFPDDGNTRPRINSFTFYQNRNFVSDETSGRIFEIIENPNNGSHSLSLFLNLKTVIPQNVGRNLNLGSPWHSGLRDVAFHPDFARNGKFYTSVMEDRPNNTSQHNYISDAANPISADSVLIEWTYNHNTNSVNQNSYREVFRVGMPVFDHPIKNITFNQFAQPGDEDYGLLYISHGDGSVQSATAGGGQNNDGLGKILRINPLQSGSNSYSIPATNPFRGNSSFIDELYAVGFRNPHNIRFSRDINGNVHLICADAGRDNMEEINIIQPGQNYGWADREGTFVHLNDGGIINGIAPLPSNEADFGFTYPSAQWIHTGPVGAGFVGQAIAGGNSYLNHADNINHCVFADFAVSGRLFYSDMLDLVNQKTKLNAGESPNLLTQSQVYEYQLWFDHDNNTNTAALSRVNMLDVIDDEASAQGNRADLRFGNDNNGNLFIMSKRNGWVYKVQTVFRSFNKVADTQEAEGAFTNSTIATEHAGFSGTGFVGDMITNGKFVEFNVNVDAAGSYMIDLRYAAGPEGPQGTRSMSIYVNGQDVTQASYPLTGLWSNWSKQRSEVSLNAGANTIRYQNDTADSGWINLDYLEVISTNCASSTNLALGKATSQSSTLSHGNDFDSSNAVDGNNNGNAGANSITHTNNEQNAWWEIDLGDIYDLSGIRLWNRTDCCAERLTNFHVLVSDVPFNSQGLAATINQNGVADLHFPGTAGRETNINLNRTGRYVRVQLSNMNTLQLAEVQIYGVERSSNSVTLYQNCNYNGANVSLSVGQYQDIASVGLVNDDVSSLRVPAGLQVTLFEHNNFGGAAITLTADNDCLINNNFNDQASSIIIEVASSAKSLQEEAALAIQSMSMYPNPASELLNIDLISEIDESTSIQIIDFSGKVMVNYNANIIEGANHLELDVNGLSSGIYFVRSTNGEIIQKLIVE